ncbi:MAG: TadE/TadG family type IV pilus assembly protein, partial [Pseudomonadota bacterium]
GKVFRSARKFRRDQKGATAIEFSLLAIPFFMLVFAIIETSISYTTEQYMGNVADRLARDIRTGRITPTTHNAAQFRTLLCDRLQALASPGCPGMTFDVRSYPTFNAVPKGVVYSSPGVVDTNGWSYNPGGSGTINSIRIVYEWPVYTDIMKAYFAGLANGKNLLYASTTWQNEPF